MQTKNPISLMLISTSLVLLFVLQFFWLQKVYDESIESIKKESNQLLRRSVLSLQDSIIQRNIVLLDSTQTREDYSNMRFRFRSAGDSIHYHRSYLDSIRSIKVNRTSEGVDIQIKVKKEGDSIRQIIASPIRTVLENDRSMRGFVFRTGIDSLKSSDVKISFTKAMQKAGLDLTFEVQKIRRGSNFIPEEKKMLVTDPVPANPFEAWIAYFPEPRNKIFADMLPQFLFCVFLSLITSGSFYLMQRSIQSQNKLMQLKNELMSNITHELKTPVATVSVALEAIKNFNVLDKPELTREYLDIAQHELNRLSLMTDKILKSALFEEKGLSFEKEQFDLVFLIEKIIQAMKLVFDKQDAKVNFVADGEDFKFYGSKVHLSNVIYNLLDNALKYSEAGVIINIQIKNENDKIIFSIRDTGIGISTEYHKKVFEKFFRVPTGDVHNIKGYGLGLSYVMNVIHGHSGTIKLNSEAGNGSCFTITLPGHLRT